MLPVRQAIKELLVRIIPVKKAWKELDRCGLIYTITGKGYFVAELSSGDMLQNRKEMIMKQMVVDTSYDKSLGE